MSDIQLKAPNLNIIGQSGWCLQYVTEIFGAMGHGANSNTTAISEWNSAAYKHPGVNPPADVAVPVWFSYNGPSGHVAVSVPGKGVYSTSAVGDKVFSSVEALVNWMGEGFKYLGYSEDINTVRVAEVNIEPAPAPAAANTPVNVSTLR